MGLVDPSDTPATNTPWDPRRLGEERQPARDSIFNYEAAFSTAYQNAAFCRPWWDEELLERNPSLARSLRWPGGAPFAAMLSHDVDGIRHRCWRQLIRVSRLLISKESSWKAKLRHVMHMAAGFTHWPSQQDLISPWLEAEKARGVRSSFFVFPTKVARRHFRDLTYRWDDVMPFEGRLTPVREVFRSIAARGWEVGIHGSISSAYAEGELARQRQDVEDALGLSVVSGRQHNLQFSAELTPDLIAASGLRVDCTLGSNRTVFFRTGTSYPHRLWSASKNCWLEVWEIPLILHDGALLRIDNLDMPSAEAFHFCTKVIERVARVRGVVSLLWHPENFIKPKYFRLYEKLLDYLHSAGAWCATAKDLAEWWQESGNASRVEEALN